MVERRCIVTRQSGNTDQLLRFVLSPDNEVVFDLKGKLPGRGAWVTGQKSYVEQAVEKKLFARAFKSQCRIGDNLAEKIDQLLEEHCLNYISLSKKAGQILTGFDKISAALSKNNVEMLIEATDGASDGQSKLENKFAAVAGEAKIVNVFSSRQMNLALGGTNVIHAAITRGTMAPGILAAVEKLQKYRGRLA
jgi:predicted RNA-binding protein YlxR (DUF448 family)